MYNPLLRITRTCILEKSFGGKSISDVLTAFIKSDFTLVWKNARNIKKLYTFVWTYGVFIGRYT